MVRTVHVVEDADTVREQEVDARLAAAGGAREHGVYSQAGLLRKIRDDRARVEESADSGVGDEACHYLLLARLREQISVPGLTRLERMALVLSGAGWRRSEAADALQVSPIRYYRVLKIARKRVAAYEGDPFAGWYEVYLSEVRRHGYRRRANR